MRKTFAVLCLFAASSFAAHADSYNFSITGNDASTQPYSFNFSLNPASYITGFGDFTYTNVTGSVNGISDALNITFFDNMTSENIGITDSSLSFFQFFNFNGNTVDPLTGDPTTGAAPTVTAGTYTGTNVTECLATVHAPLAGMQLPSTLAFFQVPTFSMTCGAAATLKVAGQSTAVTPEPSSLGLFATGALGMVGILRRRLQA